MCDKLSKYITGFRNCHGTQHSLLVMLKKWKKVLNKGENVCAIFMDLSKAFGSINHSGVHGSERSGCQILGKMQSNKMIKFLLIVYFHSTKYYQGIFLFINSVSNI